MVHLWLCIANHFTLIRGPLLIHGVCFLTFITFKSMLVCFWEGPYWVGPESILWSFDPPSTHFAKWQEGERNRTESAEPNRTEPNRTEPNRLISEPARNGRGTESDGGAEPNRTEPWRVQKTQAEAHQPEKEKTNNYQTGPNRNDAFSKITEPKQIEPDWFLPDLGVQPQLTISDAYSCRLRSAFLQLAARKPYFVLALAERKPNIASLTAHRPSPFRRHNFS